ncbi:type II secretion system protein N [Sphingorhabdus sp.]|uniref:type II secretion system protein N n=1 Tax=Sphingorhabdus sp. TaxID=1902408 RepID=UPI00391C7B33
MAERVKVQSHRLTSVPLGSLAIVLLGILLAVQVARLFWVIVTPIGPTTGWRAPSVNIVPPSARFSLFSGFDPFYRNDSTETATQNVTALSLVLFGVRANESSGGGSAIIAGDDGVQNSFGVGEEVAPGVTLDSVAFDHVILSRGGVKESLYLDQSVPAETVGPSGNMPQAGASALGSIGGLNADNLQKAIGFAPRNEAGRVTGFVLQPRDDGTMLRLAGFQAGDVVVSVNGRPVSSAADIAAQLRPGARVSVEVERGGSKIPIALNLEQQ